METKQIKLRVTPNEHRVRIEIGDKVDLFTSTTARVTQNAVVISFIKVKYLKLDESGTVNVFTITTADAAKIMNRLTRKVYKTYLNSAASGIMTKWETRTVFVESDFE